MALEDKRGGRPKGSKNLPVLRGYFKPEEIKHLVEHAKKQALRNDKVLLNLLEHIFGRPAQSLDLTSGGEALRISFDPAFKE